MDKYINGLFVSAFAFAFDGCHKIYLVEDDYDYNKMRSLGYAIYDIEELPMAWVDTCPLRFINSADLNRTYVPQCTPAHFEGWNIDIKTKLELDELEWEQLEANKED